MNGCIADELSEIAIKALGNFEDPEDRGEQILRTETPAWLRDLVKRCNNDPDLVSDILSMFVVHPTKILSIFKTVYFSIMTQIVDEYLVKAIWKRAVE